MKQPRIVLVVPAFPKLSESFLTAKFLGLRERGWNVWVVCQESDRREWERSDLLSDKRALRRRVLVCWPRRPRWLAALLAPAALLRLLARNPRGTAMYLTRGWRRFGAGALRRLYLDAELLGMRPDLVHFEFGSLAVGRSHLGELVGCRTVVSFRGYDLNYVGLEEPGYYREVWAGADALHLLGEDLWARAVRRGCPEDMPHALIPPAVDPDFFDPSLEKLSENPRGGDSSLRILSVGRLEWKKGYEYALKAVRVLKDRGIPFHYRIVGDGGYLEPVAFARHQLRLQDCVELLRSRTRREIREEMLRADVFLHAAVSEGFSNAVLEAQSMALPVVCTDADGLSANVADGETGFVVPRREPRALAEKLEQFARDRTIGKRMGEAGRRRVLTHFRLSDQIAAFEDLYRRILGMERSSAAPSQSLASEVRGDIVRSG